MIKLSRLSALLPSRSARQWLVLGLLALLGWGGAAWWLALERAALQRHEADKLQGLVLTLDGIVSQQMLAINTALRTLETQRQGWRPQHQQQDGAALLRTLAQAMPGVRVFSVVDAQGVVRAASVPALLGLSVRERDYFLTPQARHQPGMLYVSPPFHSVLGGETVMLSHALFDAQGRFDGVVAASLDPQYFRLVLETAQPSEHTWAALSHQDGLVFSLMPHDERWLGVNLARSPGTILQRHLADGQLSSLHRMHALISGDERLAAARTVRPAGLAADKFLVVSVGRAVQAMEAPWRRQLMAVLLIGSLVSLAAVLGLWLWQRRQRQMDGLRREQRALALESAAQLEAQARHTQAILDHLVDGVITMDAQGLIVSINPAASRMFGYPPQALLGSNVSRLMPEAQGRQHDRHLQAYLQGGPARIIGRGRDVMGQRLDGSVFPLNIAVSRLDLGESPLFIGLVRDITERKRHEAAIERLAFYDALTGLPNRRLLLDRLNHALAASRRSGRLGAVLFIDMDNFKSLNDTLGHGMGDQLLQAVAQRLQASLRADDTVARWGGDEFVVLLQDLGLLRDPALQHAEAAGDKLLRVLGQPYQLEGHAHHSTPSIGIVLWGEGETDSEELLKHADHAMYQAKAGGRNQMCFFDPVTQAAMAERTALESELRQAIAERALALHFQPQVARDGRLLGAETLLRWQHPQRGWISPAQFIPLAEQTGLIVPLGEWVLEQACQHLARWAGEPALAPLTLAVNLSAHQFRQKGLLGLLQQLLARSGAPPERLKLELTESAVIDDVQAVIRLMGQLRTLGLQFSLDDFGTGYSSLAYLKRLPLQQLKIDQSFVRDLLAEPNARAIARAIIQMGDSLGLEVIAEGVETEAQRDVLASQGCHAFQGYLYSKPVPLEQFETLARGWG